MEHVHKYVLPAQDGINRITEVIEGRCECGATAPHRGLWDTTEFTVNTRMSAQAKANRAIDQFVDSLARDYFEKWDW
jgi:hypothetical protein